MTSTIILSGSFQEASRYAAAKGLRNWRRVTSPEQLRGAVPKSVVILPGYERSPSFGLAGPLARLSERYGTEIITDRLPAAPPPSYGEPGYHADPLLGDVPEITMDNRRRIGETVPDFTGAQESILTAPEENQAAAVAATKRVRKTRAAARKPAVDDEQFCDTCFAGLESDEHHTKCVLPARELDELFD